MKRIPERYWDENYEDPPSPLQRAWIQRWFELLDSNTSYLFSLNTISLYYLIEDLLNLPKSNKNYGIRDYCRFIFGSHEQLKYEEVLIRERIGDNEVNSLKKLFSELYKKADIKFEKTGYKKPDVKKDDPELADLENEMEKYVNGLFKLTQQSLDCLLKKKLHTDIIDKIKTLQHSPFKSEKSFLKALKKKIGYDQLLKNKSLILECAQKEEDSKLNDILKKFRDPSPAYRIFLSDILLEKLEHNEESIQNWYLIDVITRTLITDLVVESGYSFFYLTDLCIKYFLPKVKDRKIPSFIGRANEFLNQLCPDSNSEFEVYLRVQAKSLMKNINQFSNINFSDKIDIDLEKTYFDEKKNRIEKFFYLKEGNQLIFATISDIKAADPYSAALQSLEIFTKAIQQAKFECELRGFSLDNRLYVYDQKSYKMTFISRKELAPARYGTIGDSYRLKRLLSKLALADDNWQREQNKEEKNRKKAILEKLRDITLNWHKKALEAETKESRFLNHWIGSEQLCGSFQLLEASPSDKLVFCFSNLLEQQWKIQMLNDLWGDVLRSKILGMHRVFAPENGIYLYDDECIRFKPHGKDEKFLKLPPEAKILIQPGIYEMEKYAWLASTSYSSYFAEGNKSLQDLFADSVPRVENLLFLSVYGKKLISQDQKSSDFFNEIISNRYFIEPRKMLAMAKLYDAIELLISDISALLTPFPIFKNIDFLSTDYVKKFIDNLEDIIAEKLKPYSAILGRVNPILKQLPSLKKFFKFYRLLRNNWKIKAERLKKGDLELSSALICDLFHGQSPNIHTLEDVVKKDGDKLAEMFVSQSLLAYRVKEISDVLNKKSDHLHLYYVEELDMMRRARNRLVHQGKSFKLLEILTQRLYKYNRIYLREVIHNLATKPDISADDILSPFG
ncbi:hypothetical protein QUF80_13700 [Desulfococcaceae bacterium HSG8]|nr:hypothetical protein [Desulfococcaceae bacterium HSG8]